MGGLDFYRVQTLNLCMTTNTVFSYIVQRRYSHDYENIATDALAFILDSSEAARSGLMKLLRGIVPDLPSLRFRTQLTDDNARPDMCGFDGIVRRLFIENKFWAGLTENQPVHYLKLLAGDIQPSVLLMVVPVARQETVWRELLHRLEYDKSRDASRGDIRSITTGFGPILALTSWVKVLSAIDAELADDPQARNDVVQLRALCDAADSLAFQPISSKDVTDQRTPAFIIQLSMIIQKAVDLGVTEGVLRIEGLRPTHSWNLFGRYVWISSQDNAAGAWFGTNFELWRKHGITPLWLMFNPTSFGRAVEVRTLLEPFASRKNVFTACDNDAFALAIDLVTGEEEDQVIMSIVNQLRNIAEVLSELKPRPT